MRLIILLLVLLVFSTACKKDQDEPIVLPQNETPLYICNEGAFGFSNASLSLYYPDSQVVVNHAFEQVNGRNPGDVLQSIFATEDALYMLLNGSNKIEVARKNDLKELTTLVGIPMPRYMERKGNLGFISCWGNGGEVQVLDLSNHQVLAQIPVGNGPEKMLVHNETVYVANSGGFGSDSILHVINTTNLLVEDSLMVGDNPVDMVHGDASSFWLLCRGKQVYGGGGQVIEESKAQLLHIDLITNSILFSMDLPNSWHPSHLERSPDGSTLYIGGGYGFTGIYTFDVAQQILDAQSLISNEFYGFNVHPVSGEIYALEAPSFSVAGKLKIYTSIGDLHKTITVGVGPNGLVF
jgi:hypothetical protein